MKKSMRVFNQLKEKQTIALIAPKSVEQCLTVYETLSPLGVILEIAFRTKAAQESIKEVNKAYPDALVLAGTVMTERQADLAIEAEVAGIVSADFIPDVVEKCVKDDIMCIPGGLGDVGKQLVLKAKTLGCTLEELRTRYPYQWTYKLFPAVTANNVFYELSRAWKGPFKDLSMVYTGGINLTNLPAVVKNDPEGIYCASSLTKNADNPSKMKDDAFQWFEIIKSSK